MKNILAGFPNKNVLLIFEIPNYKTIKELNLLLSANATSVHSHRENGPIGLLSLTVSTAVHDTLAGCNFRAPTNPGTAVKIPANATAA